MSFHPNEIVRRGRIATVAIGGVYLLLLGAFFRTQVVHHDRWVMQSEDNRLREIPIPAPRGMIYDRNGLVIAENSVSYTVSMLAKNEQELTGTMRRLNELIPISKRSMDLAVGRYRNDKGVRPTVIFTDASFDQVAVLEEHMIDFPSLITQMAPRRIYPEGRALAGFIGYTSEITEVQLGQLTDSGYRTGQQIGKTGLELQYESTLRGKEGSRFVEVDAKSRVIREEARADLQPVPGKDLKTNIDLDLQKFIYNIFADSLIGAAVALDPRTGAVLAIHSAPTYDPNRFIGHVLSSYYDSLNTDPRKPLLNKALQGRYAPGSTFKLATAVLGLESGAVTMNEHMRESCNGAFYYGNRFYKCWEPKGHGSLDLAGAIKHSCDVYFYQLGLKLTLARFAAGGVHLGFKNKTGIDLPNEKEPIWPDAAYLDARLGKGKWLNSGETLNMSIGQGFNTQTILNMARFYTALATDGTQPDSLRIAQGPSRRVNLISLPAEQLTQLRSAMEGVTSAGGTAASAALKGVAIAGKTGTAQSGKFIEGKELNHAWFVGFATNKDTSVVVAVMIEFGGHGTRAARIASAIIGHYLHVKSLWDLGDQG